MRQYARVLLLSQWLPSAMHGLMRSPRTDYSLPSFTLNCPALNIHYIHTCMKSQCMNAIDTITMRGMYPRPALH